MICEGIQWADELSLQWIESLMVQVAGHTKAGLLLVLTSRPGGPRPNAGGLTAFDVDLGPLAKREAREVLEFTLGQEAFARLPEELVNRLLDRACEQLSRATFSGRHRGRPYP